jgi:Mg-chelatase subunit ChlD
MRDTSDGFPAEGELDLDATLERPRPHQPEDIRLLRREPREADVVAILDMSLSMTGDKIALTALATAILHLTLDGVAVVSFDTVAHRLVGNREELGLRELIRRVLTVPAQGYTNLEAGLLAGVDVLHKAGRRERVGIVMTDGVANMGADPVAVAARFPRLHVVQVGPEEPQGARCCERMARAGRGRRYRAITYDELPFIVRTLVRECFNL